MNVYVTLSECRGIVWARDMGECERAVCSTIPHLAIDETFLRYASPQIRRIDELKWHHPLSPGVEGQRHGQVLDVEREILELHCQHKRTSYMHMYM